jgi:predicted transcriptional regulator
MDPVVVTCKISEQNDIILRTIASKRRQYKSAIIKEALMTYIAAHNGQTSIEEILTDLLDGHETFAGATARLKTLQCKAALAEAEEWVNG